MAGGKLTVRQKMINMMYLVLTALLALNVSAEILKAFHLVEVSMVKAGENIDKKNEDIIKAINEYVENNPSDEKGKDAQSRATKVASIADEALAYIGELKQTLITGAGGRKDGNPDEEIAEASNIEKHANLLINQGKGAELKGKINEWREKMLAEVDSASKKNIKSDLNTDVSPNSKQTWESEMFEHSPVAAVVTLLTKIENDVKNTEAQVLEELRKSLTKVNVVVDQFEAKIIPNNGTYITAGGKYSADIFLAASSSRSTFDLNVSGTPVKVENGIGKYEVTASGEGEKKYKAVISQKQLDGTTKTYEAEGSYFVVKPLAVVSATKMNVIYRGIENPISVSVPGYSANQISVSTDIGTLTSAGQAGTYNLTVPVSNQAKELKVSVSAKTPDGVKKMGEQIYRIKNVPKPTPMLGAIEANGAYSPAQLKSSQFVFAALKDFPFEGIKYTPVSYKIIYVPKRGDANVFSGRDQTITPEIKAAFNNAKSGDRVILTDIRAQGPVGLVPLPTSLTIDVQ
ncbi:MAG: gliding motility protein GldM [Bacteroidia bacterium]